MLPFGWYRFMAYGMPREMATSCPAATSCSTSAQVWLNLGPKDLGEIGNTTIDACVSWGFQSQAHSHLLADCCLFTVPIQVRNCGDFHVYYLSPTQGCSIAYCMDLPKTNLAQVSYRQPRRPLKPPKLIATPKEDTISFHCKSSCQNCRVTWMKRNGEDEIIFPGISNPEVTFNELELNLGEEVICGISHDLKSKVIKSKPLKTGFSLAESHLKLYNRGEDSREKVTILQHLLHPCGKRQNCNVEVKISSHFHDASSDLDSALRFDYCTMANVTKANVCTSSTSRNVCNKFAVHVRVPPMFSEKMALLSGVIEVELRIADRSQVLQVPFHVTVVPSSQCHLAMKGHIVTFDGKSFSFTHHPDFLVLHANMDDRFKAVVKTQAESPFVACQLEVKDEDDSVNIDICHDVAQVNRAKKTNITVSEAGSANTLFIDFPSGRYIRLDVTEKGFSSIILQSIPSDFERSHGICGNSDGMQDNDSNSVDQFEENDPFSLWRHSQIGEEYKKDEKPSCICRKNSEKFQTEDERSCEKRPDITHRLLRLHETTREVSDDRLYLLSPSLKRDGNDYDVENALEMCTKVLINSSITKTCGQLFDLDTEPALDMCVEDYKESRNPSLARMFLPMIEAQCQLFVSKHSSTHISPENRKALKRAVNCPDLCSRQGICSNSEHQCICDHGFGGRDCSLSAAEESSREDNTRYHKLTGVRVSQEEPCDLRRETCTNLTIIREQIIKPICFAALNATVEVPGQIIELDEKADKCVLPKWTLKEIRETNQTINFTLKTTDAQGNILTLRRLIIFDSLCSSCSSKRVTSCKNLPNVCFVGNRCYKEGEDHPSETCTKCSHDGKWMKKKEFDEVLSKREKFKMFLGDYFIFKVDGENPKIISSPYGTTLSPEGDLEWRVSSNRLEDSFEETITLEYLDNCGVTVFLKLILNISRCRCLNGGECVWREDNTQGCRCPKGLKGNYCEISADPCLGNLCQNGTCIAINDKPVQTGFIDGYFCKCNSGFAGRFCDKLINFCDTNPCFEGVECIPGFQSYFCGPCPSGLTGDGITCTRTDFCDSNPCFSGVECVQNDKYGYTCGNCPDGYVGDGFQCEKKDLCSSNPCFPGVECMQFEDSYRCGSCPHEMTGDGFTCRLLNSQDACQSNPCYEGVACYSSTEDAGFSCGSCPNGMVGDGIICLAVGEKSCGDNPCYPGVDCFEYGGKVNCGPCPFRMTGNGFNCSEYNPCRSNPCYEDVACFPLGNDFVCGNCPPGMTGNGTLCTRVFDQHNLCAHETSNPCFDKTLCRQINEDKVECTACPRGFKGDGIDCKKVSDDPCGDKVNPCHPKSYCLEVNGVATCGPCPEDMTGNGKICHSLDPCIWKPCFPGVRCYFDKSSKTNFRCGPCPDGMTGNGTDCVELKDQCFGADCPSCPEGYDLEGLTCVSKDTLDCSKNPCYPGVSCENVDTNKGYQCGPCPWGMQGDGENCTESSDFCASNPCFPGVNCFNYPDRFKCGSCPLGFTGNGLKCTKFSDPCEPSPCYPGVHCVTVWNGREATFACGICPDGMVGDGIICTRTDPCSSHPCPPSSVCIAIQGDQPSFRCESCPKEQIAQGKICRPPDFPCESSPCFAGVECINQEDTFSCGPCPEGTSGDGIVCIDIDDCKPNSCYPGVKCNDKAAPNRGFDCGPCPEGMIGDGKQCKKDVSGSPKVPCPESTRCHPEVKNCFLQKDNNSIICGECPSGYQGNGIQCTPVCEPECSVGFSCSGPDKCSPLCSPPCLNGGKCLDSGVCKCPPGFEGPLCETSSLGPVVAELGPKLSENIQTSCSKYGCHNGGSCLRHSGKCVCKMGTSGKFCETLVEDKDESTRRPKCRKKCQHGGYCVGNNRCRCKEGYRGRFCHRAKCPGGCRHGGKCIAPGICSCQPGYTGKNCKEAICQPPCLNGGKCKRPGECKCRKKFTGRFCEKLRWHRRLRYSRLRNLM